MDTQWLYDKDIQEFIRNYPQGDTAKLLMAKPVFHTVSNQLLVQQILGLHIAKRKFPSLASKTAIIYPPKVNLEQSSSEATAKYKTELISGKHLVDISCGFGIDALHFAQHFECISVNEPDEILLELVKHNFKELGIAIKNSSQMPAEQLLLPKDADWWYADPSRRVKGQRKFIPQDCVPDLRTFITTNKTPMQFMVKYSPMLDIRSGLQYLPETTEIHIVSVEGECKELLFICRDPHINKERLPPQLFAVDIDKAGHYQKDELPITDIHHTEIEFGLETPYLYEPNAAVLKAGAFSTIAARYHLKKLDVNTHLYSSTIMVENFPGYIYTIEHICLNGIKQLKLKDNNCHVVSRNYPLSAEQLTKQLKLIPSGGKYLIACTLHTKQKALIVANRLK
jgi:hypothetical protein